MNFQIGHVGPKFLEYFPPKMVSLLRIGRALIANQTSVHVAQLLLRWQARYDNHFVE